MMTSNEVRLWAEKRLELHRTDLEIPGATDAASQLLRGRIAELKELLVALRNEAPPVWEDAAH